MLASLRGASKKTGKLPLSTLADSNSHWPARGGIFSFLLFFTTEISYLIIGLWHLLEPVPLWRENSLCAAQLKPLQFVNLPLPVPGAPGGRAWCAVSDSESSHPRGQTTGWGRAIPRRLVQQAPKQGMNAALAFSQHLFEMLTRQWCFEFCQGDCCARESLPWGNTAVKLIF